MIAQGQTRGAKALNWTAIGSALGACVFAFVIHWDEDKKTRAAAADVAQESMVPGIRVTAEQVLRLTEGLLQAQEILMASERARQDLERKLYALEERVGSDRSRPRRPLLREVPTAGAREPRLATPLVPRFDVPKFDTMQAAPEVALE